MSDLLSASSLLMAVIAILFSLWYAEMTSALNVEVKKHKEDNKASKSIVLAVLASKAIPVAMMAILVSAIFVPDAVLLINEAFQLYNERGIAIESYNAVKAAYCLVTLISVVLAVYMVALVLKLWSLHRKLS